MEWGNPEEGSFAQPRLGQGEGGEMAAGERLARQPERGTLGTKCQVSAEHLPLAVLSKARVWALPWSTLCELRTGRTGEPGAHQCFLSLACLAPSPHSSRFGSPVVLGPLPLSPFLSGCPAGGPRAWPPVLWLTVGLGR